MSENIVVPFSFIEESKEKEEETNRKMYQLFVGIDIGASFHVASCISFQAFLDPKGREWKRTKTIKFNADSLGITQFLQALEQMEKQLGIHKSDFLVLLEPTGGHYSYLLQQVLLNENFDVFLVENSAVKDFREKHLGITEKSDAVDARVMSYMGWHKILHPHMKGVSLLKPASVTQSIFRSLTRDRWLLNTQLTRRKNQVQQLLTVTHPDLKVAFKKLGTPSVMKFVLKYPTGKDLKLVSQEELRQAMIESGAKRIATKASKALAEVTANSITIDVPHLVGRQNWIIEEALRIEESIKGIDNHIQELLHGNSSKGIKPHPYTELLYSFPFMSDNWGCTLIGAIGDVERFNTYKEFKKYLGVSAENKQSGTSVKGTRMTFSGVRDARRVLFQMAMIIIATKSQPSVFSSYYHRLVERKMNGKTAIGHMCGKIAKVLYMMLKTGQKYDPVKHAQATGIPWDSVYDKRTKNTNSEKFYQEALKLAGDSSSDDVELIETDVDK
ncbi:IS110 family transposase [Bacillus cereus]|uniref:IS110 family transposase n=1 Tax=Bacillus cereus TaxID=1396 RepID=UPI000BF2BE47|nr:IS110 family transposase [Bacillus cereus]MCM3200606.1 IS110 family transposase [Bacillus cereus]PFK71827.1 IS110 family transposase [Bacillus cereus]